VNTGILISDQLFKNKNSNCNEFQFLPVLQHVSCLIVTYANTFLEHPTI